MKKNITIGNIGYNASHADKTEAEFVKYFIDKANNAAEGEDYAHKALFTRRNTEQREALLKEHYKQIVTAVKGTPQAPAKQETKKEGGK